MSQFLSHHLPNQAFSIKKSNDLIGWFLQWREKKLSRNLGDVKVEEISFESFEGWLVNWMLEIEIIWITYGVKYMPSKMSFIYLQTSKIQVFNIQIMKNFKVSFWQKIIFVLILATYMKQQQIISKMMAGKGMINSKNCQIILEIARIMIYCNNFLQFCDNTIQLTKEPEL